jgi:hypothetical protein
MALLAMPPLPVNGANIHKLDFGLMTSVHSCLRMLEEGICQFENMEANTVIPRYSSASSRVIGKNTVFC